MGWMFKRWILVAVLLSLSGMDLTAEPAGSPDVPAKPAESRKIGNGFHRRPPKAFFAKLTPKERASLEKLARAGKKEELRKRMRELIYKYRPEEMKQLDLLSERYLKTQNEKDRAEIRSEMEKLVRILFRKRQDFTRNTILETEQKLARAQQDLQRLKQHYRQTEENSEKVIAGQVEQWCQPPEQRKRWMRKPSREPGSEPPPAQR